MKTNRAIAVVGMGGVFPGAANVDTFWENIIAGIDTCNRVPADRWIAPAAAMVSQRFKPDTALCDRACLINNFSFDAAAWPFEPDFLQALDPLYHLVLEAGKQAVTDGRLDSVDPKRTGTILAAIALPTDAASTFTRKTFGLAFAQRVLQTKNSIKVPKISENDSLAATVTSLPATLLADAFGFKGGAYTLDAACASSLYAIKLACDELKAGRADAMIAGGVSRPECLYTQVGFSQLRALSPTGRCAPFDGTANGLVVGEGAGILVLKRLEDALTGEDTIYAVIEGLGLSNDMRGNLLAPDSEGQLRAMRAAYAQAGWQPEDIDLIECHGAGTPVGDATELNSLVKLWGPSAGQTGQCAIGSIKSMTGHLLTAAGAAGSIKTVLALHHRVLPPSLNFSAAAENSPLRNSPFRVQTEPQPWKEHNSGRPVRAAVSAFGFGGINAHMLLEASPSGVERNPETATHEQSALELTSEPPAAAAPVAIVGMEALFGRTDSLEQLRDLLFAGHCAISKRPAQRWRGAESIIQEQFGTRDIPGGFVDSISMRTGEFRIPPAEIPDILIQHLLMLKAARGALKDAGMALRQERPEMGTVIGIEFDFEATDFHLRWDLVNEVAHWQQHLGFSPESTAETAQWLEALKDSMGAPLTASRTLGALGGIIASRVAREFRFGGPSFVVSQDTAAGLRALEIGIRSLQQNETLAMLVGAVDLPGDLRRVLFTGTSKSLSTDGRLRPFDTAATGTLPGEGVAALVIKRLDQALRDNDRVYAVISGLGTGAGLTTQDSAAYVRSVRNALDEAGRQPESIAFIETHGSGVPRDDRSEAQALQSLFGNRPVSAGRIAIGALKQNIGHTGAVAGLASVVKASLSIFSRTLAPFNPDTPIGENLLDTHPFFLPQHKIPWQASGDNQQLCGLAGCVTANGACSHVVLESSPVLNETPPKTSAAPEDPGGEWLTLSAGGAPPVPPLPEKADRPIDSDGPGAAHPDSSQLPEPETTRSTHTTARPDPLTTGYARTMLAAINENIDSTTRAHNAFLDLSQQITADYTEAFALQSRLLESLTETGDIPDNDEDPAKDLFPEKAVARYHPADSRAVTFTREMCLEFAIGSVEKMLGPDFAVVDTYPARVRLPDEPLMLVDRILSVAGVPLSLGPGQVVTEHDVLANAWYLDGGRAPVCISVEAGQADLFLSGYLGIDHAVKGTRNYRLLDAQVQFHRGLPQPGDTIRYEIQIEKFIRQQETYMFFFNFKGFIDGELLITMTDGCAGFFTPEEVRQSGGIILTAEEQRPAPGHLPADWSPPVQLAKEHYDEHQIAALRHGDLAACFGKLFAGKTLAAGLCLPGGRMQLIDRILELDPHGGRYGLGNITAQADIHPDDWFLTCHFLDDMVMPGTLMYECCAHCLRVFLLRMGWISNNPAARWEPVTGIGSVLKCRGPVTPATRHVTYTVELKKIGYRPEPYVIADAHMHADGEYIVMFRDMSLQLLGITKTDIAATWNKPEAVAARPEKSLYSRDKILAFATGKPSDAFGEPYQVFDRDRKIARLPRPPYFFMDRIIKTEPPPWELKPGGWIKAQYDLPADEWYFRADRSGCLPFCILLEIALQPCGWLAAYMGSALRSDQDLKFRNLGGKAVLHRNLRPADRTLTMCSRLSRASEAGNMIIEHFDFQVLCDGEMLYEGTTYFGFFSKQALANQLGIRGAEKLVYTPVENSTRTTPVFTFPKTRPTTPADTVVDAGPPLSMPATALCMLDRIDVYEPEGGPCSLGFVQGTKSVNPQEWFFEAHFYQDPVIPGSLGIESFLQLIKFAALEKWPQLVKTHRFEMVTADTHEWGYRGQVIPKNQLVTVESVITRVDNEPKPALYADGFLKVDGIYIYQMKNFGLKLVPR